MYLGWKRIQRAVANRRTLRCQYERTRRTGVVNEYETACGQLFKLAIDGTVKRAIMVWLKVKMRAIKRSRNLPFQKKQELLHLNGRITVTASRSHRGQYKFFSGHINFQVYTRSNWRIVPNQVTEVPCHGEFCLSNITTLN